LTENEVKGRGLKNLIRMVCFMAIGVCAFSDPLNQGSLYHIGFGILSGLIFGLLYHIFLKAFLGLFNGKLKKEQGKIVIRNAVDSGMLFLTPFVVMLTIATFLLKWPMTASFISAGIMAVGTASAIEMGKIKGKQEIRNTIATSGVSYLFSFLWTLSYPILVKAPPLLEGGVALIRQLISGGGGGI